MSAKSIEQNRIIIRRNFDELWNQGNLAAADEIYSPNYVRHWPDGRDVAGPEAVKQGVKAFHVAYPDMQFTIEDLVAEGDRVATRYTFRGTQRGEFMGVAATNKLTTSSGQIIYRLADGRIVEDWIVTA
jgi:predicted SnoaL-like aldol condensation-catalyzing enzyme